MPTTAQPIEMASFVTVYRRVAGKVPLRGELCSLQFGLFKNVRSLSCIKPSVGRKRLTTNVNLKSNSVL